MGSLPPTSVQGPAVQCLSVLTDGRVMGCSEPPSSAPRWAQAAALDALRQGAVPTAVHAAEATQQRHARPVTPPSLHTGWGAACGERDTRLPTGPRADVET